jgi:PhnB protein
MAEDPNEEALADIEVALSGYPSARFRTGLRKTLERSIVMSSGTVATVRAGSRPGFSAVTPYIIVPDVERIIEFTRRVFGAEETHRSIGSAGGLHCEIRIGESMLMLGGGLPNRSGEWTLPSRLINLHVHVDDADAYYERALEAGAESVGAPADRPYGERAGFVKDPAGNHWYIATYLPPTSVTKGAVTVTPHVYVHRHEGRGASEFMDFMVSAFDAKIEASHKSPDGMVVHGVVRIDGSAIELGESFEPLRSEHAGFYLYVEDCDALYRRAVDAGAKPLYAPTDMPYGDRMGGVADPWGNEWYIATHLGRDARK